MPRPYYPRGSEWRKWDLQVHSPFSALNNGFGENFEEYARRLFEEALEKNIVAIGVSDYFCIEGYKRLKALRDQGGKLESLLGADRGTAARRILLLPNIELRTSVIITREGRGDSRVNFHVLFSDLLDPNMIEEHFLRELKFTAESNPDHPDDRWSLTPTNLSDLGRRLKEEHAKFRGKSDLYVGMSNAVVSHEEVTQILERQTSRFKDRFLLVTPADEDLSECSWDGQAHLARKLFIQKSHMLFSSNGNTRAFGLGWKHRSVSDFLGEFKTLKPCVHGSDAHSYDSLFEPAERRYLWIKADPTFEGLRQVLHEPADRVFIGPIPASVERAKARPTKVIDSLTIVKATATTTTEKWFDCGLVLNPELIAIIGNKGGGKSALADILGLLGNTPRSQSFGFLREDRFRDPRNNKQGTSRHYCAKPSRRSGTFRRIIWRRSATKWALAGRAASMENCSRSFFHTSPNQSDLALKHWTSFSDTRERRSARVSTYSSRSWARSIARSLPSRRDSLRGIERASNCSSRRSGASWTLTNKEGRRRCRSRAMIRGHCISRNRHRGIWKRSNGRCAS